jgi:DNA-binding transcriptional ArsR family regulator
LLPFRSSRPDPTDGPRVLRVDDSAGTDAVEALASDPTRAVYEALVAEARTASEVAEATDTSIQNARYHLGKLEAAELITVADTWYSEQGNEMKVYAPADESLVVVAGTEETTTTLRDSLAELLGALGAVAIGGVVVEALFGRQHVAYLRRGPSLLPPWVPLPDLSGLASPGVVFVAGGLTALLALVLWSRLASR